MQTLTHGRSGGGNGDGHQVRAQAFSFKPRTEAVDWGKIRAARLDAIVQFSDGDALMRLANSIIAPKVSLDDLSATPPRDVLHFLTLSQLLAEYLLYEKSSLAREKDELLSRQGGSQTQLERLKAENRDLKSSYVKLKKDTARLRRTAEAYEILIKLKAADGGGQALQITSCPYCAKLFQNRSFLEAHLRKRHPNEPIPPVTAELQIGISDEEAEAHHSCLKASRVTGDYGGNSTAGIKTERVNDDATAKLQHTVQQSHDEIRRLIEQGFDTCRRELSLQFQSLQAGSSLSSSTYTSSLEVVTEKAVKELQGSQQKVEKEVDELRLLKQEIVAMKEAIPTERDREWQCLSGIATKVDQVLERFPAGEASAEQKNPPRDLEDLKEKTEEILMTVRKMENQSMPVASKKIEVSLSPEQAPQQVPSSSSADVARADGENEDRIEQPGMNKREPSYTTQQQSEHPAEENPDTTERWSDEAIETEVLVERRVTFAEKSPEILNSDRAKSTVWASEEIQVNDGDQKATEQEKDNSGPKAQSSASSLPTAEERPADAGNGDSGQGPINDANDAQAASAQPIADSSNVGNAARKVEVSIHEEHEIEQGESNAQDEQGDKQRAREHYESFLGERPHSVIPDREFAISKYSHSEKEFQDVRQQMIDYFGEELSQALESYGILSDAAGLSDEEFARVSNERAQRMKSVLEEASESERFKMEYERDSILEHLTSAEIKVGKSL